EPDSKVKRQLRAVVGETGEVDRAALQEQERKKSFIYNYYDDCCCLIELDEEPPNPINTEAVKTSFIVSKLLNAKPVDEVQVMRKTVVDGSNTTGFQRTALVAMDGLLKAETNEVRVETICLEEDAAKIIERGVQSDIYNLSRLGIPLVEIATGPDMRTPEQVKIIAEKIGNVLRSTGKCKRGLGTIRQDVNVSIRGGNRVEIKGAQDLKSLPLVVEEEVKRQSELIKLSSEITHKVSPEIIDITNVFKETEAKVIKKAMKKGVVYGIKLEGFAGFVGREIQKGRRLGSEFSDYAKIRGSVGGIFHSDELPRYGIRQAEIEKVEKKLSCRKNDAFVIVSDVSEKAYNALNAVIQRASQVCKGVPKEVRKANPDGSTSYLRPMPGGARMYPETDVMPLKMNFDVKLPELIEDKAKRYMDCYGLAKDLANDIAKSEFNELFERLARKLKPPYVAEILVSFSAQLVRDYEGAQPSLVTEEHLEKIFDAVADEKIPKSCVMDTIVDVARGEEFDLSKYEVASEDELEKGIKRLVEENKDAPLGAIMGMAMKKFQADGKKVNELVKKYKNF
ncbi:MAG: Glu-tRNA(Gln) amidotransferase subunit GatE, partial [Nanoarchaeota archaeon]